ncbi:MAG TPA: hypothetical protein VFH29_00805 [Anaerolineales bacterium]|nr:hypothetical protein [Anaerolineales bacterium]
MSINHILPFLSTAIMLGFTLWVFERWLVRRAAYFLFWGVGLAFFGIGSFAEAYLALTWNRWVFFSWYLFGAALNAAWIGHGTLLLLVRKRWVHVLTALLIMGSLFAGYLMLKVMPKLDEAVFTTDRAISEQYGTKVLKPGDTAPAGAQTMETTYRGETVTAVRGLLPLGASVRLTTPFFNIYGLLTLVGGALYSAYLFWRKRVLPNRVVGNILIAFGALLIGTASTLTRLGYGQFLYLGELLSAVLMFVGFRFAARPQPGEAPSAVPVPGN